jgi:hypothetical protein
MNEDVLFISQDYLKENSVINDNADFDLIYPTIIMCQDVYLQQAIGTPLYEDLKLAVINYNSSPSVAIPTNYSNLITYKIQKMLLWYVQMEALPLLKFRFENKGIMVKSSENSTPIDTNDLKFMMDRARIKAEHYSELLVKYLIDNTNLYPKYNEISCDGLNPVDSAYTTGIYLPDDFNDIDFNQRKYLNMIRQQNQA